MTVLTRPAHYRSPAVTRFNLSEPDENTLADGAGHTFLVWHLSRGEVPDVEA